MVINNSPELLELKKNLESFMSVNDTDRADWTQLLNNPTFLAAAPGPNNTNGRARVVLISRPNSHPFQVI